MSIGQAMRAARTKKGWTQLRLAEQIGVSEPYYSAWENDRHTPSIQALIRIADVLGISLDELTGRREKEDRKDDTSIG